MDPFTILAAVQAAIGVIKTVIAVVKDLNSVREDLQPLIIKTYDILTKDGTQVTQADLDELRALSDKWGDMIDAAHPELDDPPKS